VNAGAPIVLSAEDAVLAGEFGPAEIVFAHLLVKRIWKTILRNAMQGMETHLAVMGARIQLRAEGMSDDEIGQLAVSLSPAGKKPRRRFKVHPASMRAAAAIGRQHLLHPEHYFSICIHEAAHHCVAKHLLPKLRSEWLIEETPEGWEGTCFFMYPATDCSSIALTAIGLAGVIAQQVHWWHPVTTAELQTRLLRTPVAAIATQLAIAA